MRSWKPLLVFGPNNGDVKKIVEEKQKGQSFEYTDEDGLFDYLKKALLENETGNFNQTQSVSEFSNKAITEKIAGYLNEITH